RFGRTRGSAIQFRESALSTAFASQPFPQIGTFTMLFGGHVKSVSDIQSLRNLGLDFGELVLTDAHAPRLWRESGVKNRFDDGFFLISHGPFEGEPNNLENLWRQHLPALKESVRTAHAMDIRFLTIHLWLD